MNKIKHFLLFAFGLLIFPVAALAVESLAVQISTPKTPTNDDNFRVEFKALDINNSPVTVKCFKQSPTDAGFVQFDADKVLKNGGDSGYCQVNGSVLSSEGTYKFYVSANGKSSKTVLVDYKTSTPGTPNSYSKEKTATCQYTIKFRTDNDGGKTTKIVLYRSENTSFTAEPSSQVDGRSVGSNVAVEMVNNVSDCNKNYYYAVRAFDNAGNGSGIIGDENITSITTTTTTTSTGGSVAGGATNINATGAIPTDSSTVPNPEATPTPSTQEISVTPSISPEVLSSQTPTPFWKSNLFRFAILLIVAIYFVTRKKNR